MKMEFGVESQSNPEVVFVHSVAGASVFRFDFGVCVLTLAAKEAEYLLQGLAREIIIQREQGKMKGRAQ